MDELYSSIAVYLFIYGMKGTHLWWQNYSPTQRKVSIYGSKITCISLSGARSACKCISITDHWLACKSQVIDGPDGVKNKLSSGHYENSSGKMTGPSAMQPST
ncbi:MAG: hypothetical protein CL816_06315 [Coxiellaceae bacterium]|nr:hypothetical protein [Coxiellaceae bacterium]